MRMSNEQKEKTLRVGEWLYRAVAIFLLSNIYMEVNKVDVHEERLNKHDQSIDRLDNAVFAPSWLREKKREQSINNEKADTNRDVEYTEANLLSSTIQIKQVDSFLNNN